MTIKYLKFHSIVMHRVIDRYFRESFQGPKSLENFFNAFFDYYFDSKCLSFFTVE